MRKITYTLLLCLAITQSVTSQKIQDNNFIYSEGITYSVTRFNNAKTTQYGSGGDNYTYIANGGRFKTAWIEFSNATDHDVEINFEQMYLIDKNNKKYHVHMVVQSGKVTGTGERYKQKLKGNKSKLFFAEFWPPYPKDEKLEKTEVNGKIITLKEVE